MFPCLRPGNSYLILQQGEAKLAKGALCLALQGIGTEEAEAFSLLMEEEGMLRQLAWQCLFVPIYAWFCD